VLLSNLDVGIENNVVLTISTRGHRIFTTDASGNLDSSSSKTTNLIILAGKNIYV